MVTKQVWLVEKRGHETANERSDDDRATETAVPHRPFHIF